MKKTYNKFNIIGLLVIVFLVLLTPLYLSKNEGEVKFSDKGLESAVRSAINKPEGTIYSRDVDMLQVLDAKDQKIKKLDGIEHLSNLRELDLENNFVEDVSPLRNNTKLRILNLRNNGITNLEDINFQDIIYLHIRDLSLRHNVIRDEEGNDTRIEDISLIGHMTALRKLSLRDNDIKDLTPISNLRNLRELDLRENKFKDIKALETLNRLESLNIEYVA